MTNMKHEARIIETLTPYLMAFPQSKMNEGSLLVYAKALSRLSIAEIEAAMLKLIQTNKFFPSVAEIFEQAEIVTRFVTKTDEKSADEAWREILQEVHDAFVYRKPQFSSREIEQAALNMGWTSLCNLEIDAMNTARAQFMRIYKSILSRKKEKTINQQVLDSLPEARIRELTKQTVPMLSLVREKAVE